MLFRNGGDFGVKDPQFGIDIGFYVFDYPFWRYLLGVGFTASSLAVLGALAVHYLYGGVRLQGVGDRMTHRRPGPPDRAGRAVRAAQGGRVLPGPAGAAARATTPAPTCGAPATPTSTRCCRPRRSWPTSRSWWRSRSWSSPTRACATWSGPVRRSACSAICRGRDRRHLPVRRAARSRSSRTSADKEAPYIQRSIDAHPAGVRARTTSTDTPYARRQPDAAGDRWPPTQHVVPNIRLLDPAVVNETFTQYQQIRGVLRLQREARHRPVHDRTASCRTTWSASARSTTPS